MIKDAKFHSSVKDLTAPPPVNQIDDFAVHLAHVSSMSPQTELDQKTFSRQATFYSRRERVCRLLS
jgi:hypothetical protein